MTDKSRQQFEEFIKFHMDDSEANNKFETANNGLNYAEHYVDIMWIAWEASRESLESQIKPNQFSQLVNDTKDAAIKYKDCQCLRDALSRVMRDSLISNGVKIKDE